MREKMIRYPLCDQHFNAALRARGWNSFPGWFRLRTTMSDCHEVFNLTNNPTLGHKSNLALGNNALYYVMGAS
jgi:hypothetical protein